MLDHIDTSNFGRYNSQVMARYLDPKSDLVFKKIFGEHPNLLKDFLNAILPLPQDCTIESLTTSYNEAELLAYDKSWDAVSSERTLLSGKYAEGKAEVAIKLHQLGLPMDQIVSATGFNAEQLEELFS